ncbi:MAG TPA: ATP-grasp domain-containing protein [Anaerolineales bacterium]|nr:ATP-grasp domain-containing protein [Anaerolineales bacterium]
MTETQPVTILCLASYFKGTAFIQAAKQLGCTLLLITRENMAGEAWPREFIDEFFLMPRLQTLPDILYAVSYLARSHNIDRIIALDDYDVETAGILRDHLRLPGMSASHARHFRDKLTMRGLAHAARIPVPEFTAAFNYQRLREFMERVPPPWLLKPRSEASAMGINTIQHADQLWPMLDKLGDQQSFFLLERFLPGDVFHVDGLVEDGKPIFAEAHQYARPPMSVYQGGGVFVTRTLERTSPAARSLAALNRRLLKALDARRGAFHAEYIRSHGDGKYYFLECAARVGGANIAEAIEYATGINLWAEWARLEIAHLRGQPYQLPERRLHYSGLINCLARQEYPDLSAYQDSEVVWRSNKKQHAGLILTSPDPDRLQSLLDEYSQRFAQDFLAVLPPQEKGP